MECVHKSGLWYLISHLLLKLRKNFMCLAFLVQYNAAGSCWILHVRNALHWSFIYHNSTYLIGDSLFQELYTGGNDRQILVWSPARLIPNEVIDLLNWFSLYRLSYQLLLQIKGYIDIKHLLLLSHWVLTWTCRMQVQLRIKITGAIDICCCIDLYWISDLYVFCTCPSLSSSSDFSFVSLVPSLVALYTDSWVKIVHELRNSWNNRNLYPSYETWLAGLGSVLALVAAHGPLSNTVDMHMGEWPVPFLGEKKEGHEDGWKCQGVSSLIWSIVGALLYLQMLNL